MQKVIIGGAVVALVAIAFVMGTAFTIEDRQGPAEEAGEALDNMAGELGGALENAVD